MAIDLSAKYPGQVATGVTGYPYGKPQNTTAPGDGTGTPLEEQWMQDVHGFLQALLVDGGVTPSGTPDKTTLSQYLNVIRRFDYRKITDNLTGTQNAYNPTDGATARAILLTLTGSQTINGIHTNASATVRLKFIINADSADTLTLAHESGTATDPTYRILTPTGAPYLLAPGSSCWLFYDTVSSRWRILDRDASVDGFVFTTPPSRTVLVPIRGFLALSGTWSLVSGALTTASTAAYVSFPLKLPQGAVITQIRAGVQQQDSILTTTNRMQFDLFYETPDKTAVALPTATTVIRKEHQSGSSTDVITPATLSTTIDNVNNEYYLGIQSAATITAGTDKICFLEVTFTDPGPRNY